METHVIEANDMKNIIRDSLQELINIDIETSRLAIMGYIYKNNIQPKIIIPISNVIDYKHNKIHSFFINLYNPEDSKEVIIDNCENQSIALLLPYEDKEVFSIMKEEDMEGLIKKTLLPSIITITNTIENQQLFYMKIEDLRELSTEQLQRIEQHIIDTIVTTRDYKEIDLRDISKFKKEMAYLKLQNTLKYYLIESEDVLVNNKPNRIRDYDSVEDIIETIGRYISIDLIGNGFDYDDLNSNEKAIYDTIEEMMKSPTIDEIEPSIDTEVYRSKLIKTENIDAKIFYHEYFCKLDKFRLHVSDLVKSE